MTTYTITQPTNLSTRKRVGREGKIKVQYKICRTCASINYQSGIFLNLRTGPTGHATLFNQWEGALVFINKQISLHEFFFSLTACAGIFFPGETLCTNCLFRQILLFFWTVKSWFIIYVFLLYKLFYTHNRSKDTGHF